MGLTLPVVSNVPEVPMCVLVLWVARRPVITPGLHIGICQGDPLLQFLTRQRRGFQPGIWCCRCSGFHIESRGTFWAARAGGWPISVSIRHLKLKRKIQPTTHSSNSHIHLFIDFFPGFMPSFLRTQKQGSLGAKNPRCVVLHLVTPRGSDPSNQRQDVEGYLVDRVSLSCFCLLGGTSIPNFTSFKWGNKLF